MNYAACTKMHSRVLHTGAGDAGQAGQGVGGDLVQGGLQGLSIAQACSHKHNGGRVKGSSEEKLCAGVTQMAVTLVLQDSPVSDRRAQQGAIIHVWPMASHMVCKSL